MHASITSAAPLLEVVALGKRFPGVVALDDVSLTLQRGEVHGLIGQNGAGKSTLINILSGMHAVDSGEIRMGGERVAIRSPRDALQLGIATVYQELSLLPNLTIAENLVLGREPRRRGLFDRRAMNEVARRALDRLGLPLDPATRVAGLSLAQKQLVEIAKSLSTNPRVLILDEPTAPLGGAEIELLFQAIERLKAQGVAILYVSHRFAEVLSLCDVATVLRNGRHVVTTTLEGWTEGRLTEAIIDGRTELFERKARHRGSVVLSLESVSFGTRLRSVSLAVHAGEVLGVTGLLGAGQNELGRLIGGDIAPDSGSIDVAGSKRRFSQPGDAIDAGICLLTEERKQEGILPNLSLRENIAIGSLDAREGMLGIVRGAKERQAARAAATDFAVVAASLEAPIRSLSGGNQQKALVARWQLANMDVFVLIEPTRGVDVGARAEIYRRLDELARTNKAIVIVSSDLAEVLTLADRVIVIRDGVVAAEVAAGDADEERLNLLVQGAA